MAVTPRVDRAALHAFVTGSPKLGAYPASQWQAWEERRRVLLAECKTRGITVHLTGSNAPGAQTHAPVTTLLGDVVAQLGERWPDPTRADGMAWSFMEAVEQVWLCAIALDAADRAHSPAPAPTPAPATDAGWRTLPILGSPAATSDRSSFQSAIPDWTAGGMVVALPAKGDKPNTPNPTKGGSTQRCEIHLAGWGGLTGTQYLRYDFTLARGFPIATGDWQAIAQLKNSDTGSPPLEVMVGKGGRVYLQWHDKNGRETGTEHLGSAATEVHHAVVLKVEFSTGADAKVSGWYEGKPVFTDVTHGPTMYPGQSIYGKLGLYRSNAIGVAATITHHGVARGATLAAVTG